MSLEKSAPSPLPPLSPPPADGRVVSSGRGSAPAAAATGPCSGPLLAAGAVNAVVSAGRLSATAVTATTTTSSTITETDRAVGWQGRQEQQQDHHHQQQTRRTSRRNGSVDLQRPQQKASHDNDGGSRGHKRSASLAAVSFPGASEVLSLSPSGGVFCGDDRGVKEEEPGELLLRVASSSCGMSVSSSTRSLDASSERWSEAFDADDSDTTGTEEESDDDDGSTTCSCDGDGRTSDILAGGGGGGGGGRVTGMMLALSAMAEAERRRRRRRRRQDGKLATCPAATTFGIPRLRDPLGIKPPIRKPQLGACGGGGGGEACRENVDPSLPGSSTDTAAADAAAAAFTDPVEEVWDSLSAWHQCFIDRWPPETMAPGEVLGEEARRQAGGQAGDGPSHQGRLLIEEWLRCSDGSPHLCAERLRRLANGRACWGWPEASFRARDVADALLTGAMKLLPGGPPRGSTRGPCSPPILVVHTRLINHDRCPPALYARGLSYLMQTLAEGRRTSGAGAAGGGTRRDSEGGAVTGGGPADVEGRGGGGPAPAAAAADVAALAHLSAGFGFGDGDDVDDSEEGDDCSSGGGSGGGSRGGSGGGGGRGGSPSSRGADGPWADGCEDDHAEVVLVIDARKDTVGVNVKKIISLFIGEGGAGPGDDRGSGGIRKSRDSPRGTAGVRPTHGGGAGNRGSAQFRREGGGDSGAGVGSGGGGVSGDGVGGWDGTMTSRRGKGQQQPPLCDPAVSMRPVTIRKVLILHAGPVLKALLLPRRVSLSGAGSSPSWDLRDSGGGGGVGVGLSGSGVGLAGGRVTARRGSSSPRRASTAVSKSFLAVSGGVSREWLRHEVGEEVAACLPRELGGDFDLGAWSWEGWVGRRMQREDLAFSNMGLADEAFVPATSRYLDACHHLAESTGTQEYARVLSDALEGGLTVPVAWVKRTLCDVAQAREAHEPPWRGTAGAKRPGSTSTSRGLHDEWAQLWKDMGRDVVEIRGDRLDLSTSAAGGLGGGGGDGGGTAGAAGGNPEAVLAPLAKEIERVGVENGMSGLSEVQCFLAARDILLSTKRTSSGGDVWVCVDRLCGMSRDLVVVCPASNEADPLHISAEFDLENHSGSGSGSGGPPVGGGAAGGAVAGASGIPSLSRTNTTGDFGFPSELRWGGGGRDAVEGGSGGGEGVVPVSRPQEERPACQLSSTWGGTSSDEWGRARARSAVPDMYFSLGREGGVAVVQEEGEEEGEIRGRSRSALADIPSPAGRGGGGAAPAQEEEEAEKEEEEEEEDGAEADKRSLSPSVLPRLGPVAHATAALPRVTCHASAAGTVAGGGAGAPRRRSEPSPPPSSLSSRAPFFPHGAAVIGKPAVLPTAAAAAAGDPGGRHGNGGGGGGGSGTGGGGEGAGAVGGVGGGGGGVAESRGASSSAENGRGGRRDRTSTALRKSPPPLPPRPGGGNKATAAAAAAEEEEGREEAATAAAAGDAPDSRSPSRGGRARSDRRASDDSYENRPKTPPKGGLATAAPAAPASGGVMVGIGVGTAGRASPFATATGVGDRTWRGGMVPGGGYEALGGGGGVGGGGGRGCVRVTVTTEMSHKICDANPSCEDGAVIGVVTGVFERVFRVRVSGAVQGLQPTDDNPVVRMKLEERGQ